MTKDIYTLRRYKSGKLIEERTTQDKTIAYEKYEKFENWSEQYTLQFGRSTSCEMLLNGQIIKNTDFE